MVIGKIKSAIKKYHLINKKDKIVVGVSGGADSVALLMALNHLKKEFALTLHVAHLDHMLRRDSAKDAEFVKELAAKLKIPLTLSRIKVKRLRIKGSLEEAARNARLAFFFKVARRLRAKKIALGHNLDDQAETVLMRILRGTGLYGLAGISPKRNIGSLQLIRPLIGVRRKEIEVFLKRRKIKYRTDSTNSQEIFFRNKVRLRLMPLLAKEYNRNIKEILSHMAESLACDYDYLNRIADNYHNRLGRKIRLKRFFKLHPAIQRLVLRLNIARLQGDTRRITFRHIREIEDLILNRPANSVVDLPKGIAVVKRKNYFNFYRR
jgi:tRNA(Ile)-lysidine synthase